MIKKLIFAAGAGVGYVLGTRAGRQQYDKMRAKAREVLDRPDVKEATDALQTEANRLYDEGRQLVRDRVRSIRERNGEADTTPYPAAEPTVPGLTTGPTSGTPRM